MKKEDLYLLQSRTRQIIKLLMESKIDYKYSLEEHGGILLDIITFKTLEGLKMAFYNVLDEKDNGGESWFGLEEDESRRREIIERYHKTAKIMED